MPLFLKNRLLFIHIPKCGGDTLTFHMRSNGDEPFLFVADGAVMVNGHTPQHMTWKELLSCGWKTPSDFRIAATVRHPVDRVISEYQYARVYRPDLVDSHMSPKAFLDDFLRSTYDASKKYDNHNLGLLEFLTNESEAIDQAIEVYEIHQMDELVSSLNLPKIDPRQRRNVTQQKGDYWNSHGFDDEDISRIQEFYKDDLHWIARIFPNIKRDY